MNTSMKSGITLLAPKVCAFGGKAVLSFEDLGAAGTDLPREIIEPGSKRLLDPKLLRPFATFRKQMHRACGAIGSRADGGGYLVPTASVPALSARLNDIEKKWNAAKEIFLKGFPDAVEAWASAHDEDGWGSKIRSAVPTVAELEQRIVFKVRYRSFGAPTDEAAEAVGDGGISDELGELPTRIVEELAFDAAETYLKAKGAEALKSCLERCVEKLSAWSWLDTRVENLNTSISKFLAATPANHKEWDDLQELTARSLIQMLSNPANVLKEVERGELVVASPVAPTSLFMDVADPAAPVAAPHGVTAPPSAPSSNPAVAPPPPVAATEAWAGLGW